MKEISGQAFGATSNAQAGRLADWAPPPPPLAYDSQAPATYPIILGKSVEQAVQSTPTAPYSGFVRRQSLPASSAPHSLQATKFMAALCTLAAMHAQLRAARPENNAKNGQAKKECSWWNISAAEVHHLKLLTLTHGSSMLGYVLGPDGTVFQWTPQHHAENNCEYDSLKTVGRFHRNGDYIPIRQPVLNGVREYQYDRMIPASTIKCWSESKQWRSFNREQQAYWCWAA